MQNAGLQYGEGVTPVQESPFGVTPMQNNSTSSSTSSLRQFRKKENVDKTPGAAGGHPASVPRADTLNSSHVARVAPHNHYPHKQNEYYRYPPQYQEYSSPYKEHTVKYSEIAEPVPQAIPHLEHLPTSVLPKHKEKEYAEMCNIPQQPHLNKPFSEHQYNGQQNYPTEMALHHQYMQKEPQGPQMHSPYKPESQYIPKEGTFNHQISPFLKYNIPTQSRNYAHLENSSLGSFQRMDPHIARSLMSEHPHIRDFSAEYGAMEQSRMYAQKQRYYPAPLPPTNPTYPPNYSHRNMPTQQYNYTNCNYPRTAQVNSSMGRYPMNMERSMSPRRTYPENLDMGMNFPSVPQKISPSYPNYPAYAQHYQHRRPSAIPQEYYHPQQHPHARPHPQYMPAHHPQEVAENHVASNNIRQYLENWAEEESTTEISPQIDNPKYIPRINRDEANEVFVINASELPQYLEGGVPLVTSENGQYIFKSNVSIDNTGAIKILEKTVDNAVLPVDAQERVVSLHIIENPKADCLINARTTNINQEHPGSVNQVPAATINVITTNTNHSNQEHTVQHSYNVATPTFNANRMNLMHHMSPVNQSGPQHNQNYENSVNLCLHPSVPGENHSSSQQAIVPNSTTLEHNIRLSPHIQSIDKSLELPPQVQNNVISDGVASDKNHSKSEVVSYQEVPQNSCIVMPSTQSRLNFDESLLPNQVPSDGKGAKSEFEVRNDDESSDESSAMNVISTNENILDEAHEELDKIVEDTLTSSNINIPLVNCEGNHLPKIQEKCDTANSCVNSRIPDDLNLDLESNHKDLTVSAPDYTIQNINNQENEDIMDLSTSRRGSKNDNDEQEIQSIELDLSISSVQSKLEQNVPEASNDLPILTEYSASTDEDVTANTNAEEEEEISSPKSSMKHMPLIDDHSEARANAADSETVTSPDIEKDPNHSLDTSKSVEQEKSDGIGEENDSHRKEETEETDTVSTVQTEISDASTSEYNAVCLPNSETKENIDLNISIDTALEAKLSEIVGEPYHFPEEPVFIEKTDKSEKGEKERSEQDDNADDSVDLKEATKLVSEEPMNESPEEVSKNTKDRVIEGSEDVLCSKSAPLIDNTNENPPLQNSDDTSQEKKTEGCRKRRIFSVDDIIYRIGPNTLQNRRESIHSMPDSDCTIDSFTEESKVEDHLRQTSNEGTKIGNNSDVVVSEKEEESGIPSELVLHSKETTQASETKQSDEGVTSEITNKLQEMDTIQKIVGVEDCNDKLKNECLEKSSSPASYRGSRSPCNESDVPEGTTVEKMITEGRKPNNDDAVVLIETTKSSAEEIAANVNIPEKNSIIEEGDKVRSLPEESRCSETVRNDVLLLSEAKSHLLASEHINSVNRTSEFVYLVGLKSTEGKLQDTEDEKVNMSTEELSELENHKSEEMDVSEDQELVGNISKRLDDEREIIRSLENDDDDSSDEPGLIISEHADAGVGDDCKVDCSESEDNDDVTRQTSENVCTETEDIIENEKRDTNEETESIIFNSSDAPSDVRMEDDIQRGSSHTYEEIENNSHNGSLLHVCRFSVIHKTEDSTRIIHQEKVVREDNYEATITKNDVGDPKTQEEKSKHPEYLEQKEISDDIAIFNVKNVLSEEVTENSVAETQNHCSVIQSIEDTMQHELNRKILEPVENEELSSEKIEKCKEKMDKTEENVTNMNELRSMQPLEDHVSREKTSKKLDKSKCSSLSSIQARKEELTFEQKFIEPFCNQSEENIHKTEEIEDKPSEEIQYRSVLKIEENNVLLEIGGELVEITVNQVNGKSVITVIPLSNTATVDFNDNYENVDRAQLCQETVSSDSQEDVRDELIKSNGTKEDYQELTKIVKSSDDDEMVHRSEDISSTQSEVIGEIFEDIILNENEIIIGDEGLEEEINLDLQSKEEKEDEEKPKPKPVLCTKAAKKLYDDMSLHIPTKTYSSLREFRRIKSKPESTQFGEEDTRDLKSNGKKSSKRSTRISARRRTVSEQKEGSQTALKELIERRKMRKEKIRLKYTQYAKQESKIVTETLAANSLNVEGVEEDAKKLPTVPVNVVNMERLPMSCVVKKAKTDDEVKRREFKKNMHGYKEKIRKKPVAEKRRIMAEESDIALQKEQTVPTNLEIEKKKLEEKPTSTSVIVSSSISTIETSPKNFHEAGTTTARTISKSPSCQDKTPKFPKISTPRDLSLTKNVNEHYLSRKDHSNLKKKLSIQEYNSRKRKSDHCKSSVPEKSVKLADEVANASTLGVVEGVARPSTIYSDKQIECLTTSVKDPRRRPRFANMQPTKLLRTQSEDLNTFQTQSISSSRPHKLTDSTQSLFSVKLKDPLLNSNESYNREVQNYKNYKTLLLGKSSVEKYIPKPMKISNRRKTIEVMNDRKLETTEVTKKKVSFDDNVQINEINTTQTRIANIKPEVTNYCEVTSSCSDILDDKNSEDSRDRLNDDNEEIKKNVLNVRSDEKRKNDWEDSNSPKDSITDVFAESFLEKSKVDNSKNQNKSKLIIDIRDFDTSLIDNELKSPYRGCFNGNTTTYEDTGSLQNYKEEVDTKLNSLNIQIPQTPKSRLLNEDDVLIHKFLRKEQLSSEEIKQIRRIIYFKKKIQQLTHQNANAKVENDSYEVKKNYELSLEKDLKLQLKKIDGRLKKKRRRFRNLYSDSPESSEGDVQGTAGEFSVYEGENMSGVKLIFRRKTDLLHLQPVVRLQRCKYIDSMAKKLKFE